MPTVILLDVSLSMSRSVDDSSNDLQRRHLAITGINTFLDYLSANVKLEFVSLVIFSSLYEQLVPFTRDYNDIRTALTKLDEYNKTCLETALAGVNSLIIDEWGLSSQCQVLLVTDGRTGVGDGSLTHMLQSHTDRTHRRREEYFRLPFKFACKLHVACIVSSSDSEFSQSEGNYKELITINGHGGEVFACDGQLSVKTVQQMFTNISNKYFYPYTSLLKCQNLKCPIQIFPALENYEKDTDFTRITTAVKREIEICGFLEIADVASPPYISRHLVLPMSVNTAKTEDNGSSVKMDVTKDEGDDKDGADKLAAFTVLLHGSLKVEGMVAVVEIGDDWYGMMYSFADSKKKSNLMLSVFQPGRDSVPWLGTLTHLAPLSDFTSPPYGEDDTKTPFPVTPAERRSYSQNCVVWIKNTGLQADIQKILRNARKLPEKQQHFYKELNRLRKAALSFGFYELLDATAQLLDRECTLLPSNAHPDAALQMTHAASILRSELAHDATINILPLRTNFSID